MIIWAENVLIPPDQNLSKAFDENVLIFLVRNIYVKEISSHFDTKKYARRLDIVPNFPIPPDQNLSIPLCQNVLIFLVRNIFNGNI